MELLETWCHMVTQRYRQTDEQTDRQTTALCRSHCVRLAKIGLKTAEKIFVFLLIQTVQFVYLFNADELKLLCLPHEGLTADLLTLFKSDISN